MQRYSEIQECEEISIGVEADETCCEHSIECNYFVTHTTKCYHNLDTPHAIQ